LGLARRGSWREYLCGRPREGSSAQSASSARSRAADAWPPRLASSAGQHRRGTSSGCMISLTSALSGAGALLGGLAGARLRRANLVPLSPPSSASEVAPARRCAGARRRGVLVSGQRARCRWPPRVRSIGESTAIRRGRCARRVPAHLSVPTTAFAGRRFSAQRDGMASRRGRRPCCPRALGGDADALGTSADSACPPNSRARPTAAGSVRASPVRRAVSPLDDAMSSRRTSSWSSGSATRRPRR